MAILSSASEEIPHTETTPLLLNQTLEDTERLSEPRLHICSRESQNNNQKNAFTWTPFISILFMSLVQPLCFELIFPFINQMIVENGVVDDPEEVGYYSGIIESIFQFMSFITIMPCSIISDYFGRRPVVLLGTTGMSISITLFGMSKTYPSMILTRCIGGTLGGTWSALKVIMAELYPDKAQRTFVFSTFQIAFRIGQVSGQPLGGLLSHPEKSFRLFDTPFWHKYPFSLPCFIASTIGISSVVFAYFMLQETRKRHPEAYEQENESERTVRPSLVSALTSHVISVVFAVMLMTLASETLFAVYPLFAFTPIASGGLGLSAPQIGAHMAIRSALQIAVLTLYQPLSRLLTPMRMYQCSMSLWPLIIVILPILNSLARTSTFGVGSWVFNCVLGLLFTLWGFAGFVWPSSQIVVVEAPPNQDSLATVNVSKGIAQTMQALMMAVSPALVTTLFAFSIQSQIFEGNLIYIVLFGLGIIGAVQSYSIEEKGENEQNITTPTTIPTHV